MILVFSWYMHFFSINIKLLLLDDNNETNRQATATIVNTKRNSHKSILFAYLEKNDFLLVAALLT